MTKRSSRAEFVTSFRERHRHLPPAVVEKLMAQAAATDHYRVRARGGFPRSKTPTTIADRERLEAAEMKRQGRRVRRLVHLDLMSMGEVRASIEIARREECRLAVEKAAARGQVY